jgi:hypothetical protein
MSASPAIHWRNVAPAVPVERFIRNEASRLSRFYPGLRVHRVDVAAAEGDSVHVGIQLRAPERQVIVNYEHAEVEVAVRKAFQELFRKFERRIGGDRRSNISGQKQLRAA